GVFFRVRAARPYRDRHDRDGVPRLREAEAASLTGFAETAAYAWTAGPRGCEEIETSLPNGAPASGRQRKNTIRVLVSKRRDRFTHSILARQRMPLVRASAAIGLVRDPAGGQSTSLHCRATFPIRGVPRMGPLGGPAVQADDA